MPQGVGVRVPSPAQIKREVSEIAGLSLYLCGRKPAGLHPFLSLTRHFPRWGKGCTGSRAYHFSSKNTHSARRLQAGRWRSEKFHMVQTTSAVLYPYFSLTRLYFIYFHLSRVSSTIDYTLRPGLLQENDDIAILSANGMVSKITDQVWRAV